MQLNDLKERMRACAICADLPLGPKPLFQLSHEAKILIAGQAPGRKTHEKGRPFDDASGNRLRTWLGMSRETFYEDPRVGVLPMGLCYPGTGAQGDLPPRVECAPAWRAEALSHLVDLELTLVIGRYAIDWHIPDFKRLSVTEAAKRSGEARSDTLVLPHPSPRNNRWLLNNPWFEADIVPDLQEGVRRLLTE